MEKPFVLNPALTRSNIKDAIDERFNKSRGILNCLMFAIAFVRDGNQLDNDTVYHVLWVIDGFLDEICCLKQKIDQMGS